MMRMMKILMALCFVTSTVNGCPVITSVNGSCCEINSSYEFKFSTSPLFHSRVYNITNFCGDCEDVAEGYCDSTTTGGGWLVIQRRDKRYSTNFHRGWEDYVEGFGHLEKEFWYGLRAIHCLTNQEEWEMRVDFTFENGTKSYMHYKHFQVKSESHNYQLSISGFTGITPADPFVLHELHDQPFSTYDKNNHGSCAVNGHGSKAPGGWWFKNCFFINLNYNYGGPSGFISFDKSTWFNPPFIETKIRPVNC